MHSIRTVIVFKTFKGYSHGSTDLTISYDPGCIGWNYMGTIVSHCSAKFAWYHWKDHSNEKTHSPTCSVFWLTHYVTDILNPSELENCIFSFNLRNKLRHTVGSFKFIVSGLIVYKNFTSLISSRKNSDFNMIIESISRRHFPFNPTKKKTVFNLNLPTTSKQTFLFNPVSNLHVKFNYTGVFQQLMFVIRMQIVENVICISVEDHHPLDITQIYTLNSDISDVYLSRIYPYNGYMIKSMNYTGHNRGSCRVLLKGQSCSHSSSYKVIQIHYEPNIKLEAAHRVQISMKRTLNCAFHCPLNVRIWEVSVTDNIRQLHCHEWRGIYHLTWQVIAASYSGFSVHINATCDKTSCRTKLCDVAVTFNVMLTWLVIPNIYTINLKRNHYDIIYDDYKYKNSEPFSFTKWYEITRTDVIPGMPLRLGHFVYGSWNEAHKYCQARNLYLSTLSPSLMEQLRYTIATLSCSGCWGFLLLLLPITKSTPGVLS